VLIVANSGGIVGFRGPIRRPGGGAAAGLRLAAAQVFAQRRGPARLLPGLLIIGLLLLLLLVRHAKRLRHFRPCGKERATRGPSTHTRAMLP